MPPIIKLEDQNQLVKTDTFPKYAKFPFEDFNPVQSRVFEIFDKDANVVVAAQTAAGKTVCAEMIISHEVRVRGNKAIYLAPMKALAKEKIDDWTSKEHHFANLKLTIITGDYKLTPERKNELKEANIIVMTNEMLSSRCRHYKSEGNDWLKDVGVIICDEVHLLGTPARGTHAEVGLMKFCKINPTCRLVALSATLPNVEELGEWFAYSLNNKETCVIRSKYRPCPLGIHWETYEEKFGYERTEESKIEAALEIIDQYPSDKFLVFVHTKKTGERVFKALQQKKIICEYHNADLDTQKRIDLETRFKKGNLRVLVATSTLAWGCNTPARRVVIVGVHRGIQEVDTYDILQEIGRSGRPGFDPRGDAYILVPEKKAENHIERLSKPQDIRSQLLEYVGDETNPHYKNLAFHLVSEIHYGDVKKKDDVREWYEKTFACFQAHDLDDLIIEQTLELLLKCGAIKIEDDIYKTTMTGKIASLFYFSPFDVADLRRGFKFLFDQNQEENDIALSMALGNVDSLRMGYCSKAETEEMGTYMATVNNMFGDIFIPPAIKAGYTYFTLLNGLNSGIFGAMARNFQIDVPRTIAVLNALDSMSCKWDKKDWFSDLQLRINYGVKKEMLDLCRISNVGKVRAEKLWNAGIRTLDAVASMPSHVQKVLNMKEDAVKDICKSAENISNERKLAEILS